MQEYEPTTVIVLDDEYETRSNTDSDSGISDDHDVDNNANVFCNPLPFNLPQPTCENVIEGVDDEDKSESSESSG